MFTCIRPFLQVERIAFQQMLARNLWSAHQKNIRGHFANVIAIFAKYLTERCFFDFPKLGWTEKELL